MATQAAADTEIARPASWPIAIEGSAPVVALSDKDVQLRLREHAAGLLSCPKDNITVRSAWQGTGIVDGSSIHVATSTYAKDALNLIDGCGQRVVYGTVLDARGVMQFFVVSRFAMPVTQ
jgi:hypothetical protein